MANSDQPWTNSEIEKLIEMFWKGKTYTEMMEPLGKTRNSIAGKCNRLGLKRVPDPVKKKKSLSFPLAVPVFEYPGRAACAG